MTALPRRGTIVKPCALPVLRSPFDPRKEQHRCKPELGHENRGHHGQDPRAQRDEERRCCTQLAEGRREKGQQTGSSL